MTEARRRRIMRRAGAVIAAMVMVGVLLPGFSVTQAGYYSRYPKLKTRMHNWSVSTHSKMSCVACHIEPGTGAFLLFAGKAIPAFYSQLVRGPQTTNLLSAPGRKACHKCHTQYRKVAPSGDLLIPHRAHVEVLEIECGTCHKFLVHAANRRGFNRPEMEGCVEQCHDGDKAGDECVSCHTDKNVPASHEGVEWFKSHGARSESEDCTGCHKWTPDYCGECHSRRPSTHVGNWKKGHASVARKRAEGCPVCHQDGFCEECH